MENSLVKISLPKLVNFRLPKSCWVGSIYCNRLRPMIDVTENVSRHSSNTEVAANHFKNGESSVHYLEGDENLGFSENIFGRVCE